MQAALIAHPLNFDCLQRSLPSRRLISWKRHRKAAEIVVIEDDIEDCQPNRDLWQYQNHKISLSEQAASTAMMGKDYKLKIFLRRSVVLDINLPSYETVTHLSYGLLMEWTSMKITLSEDLSNGYKADVRGECGKEQSKRNLVINLPSLAWALESTDFWLVEQQMSKTFAESYLYSIMLSFIFDRGLIRMLDPPVALMTSTPIQSSLRDSKAVVKNAGGRISSTINLAKQIDKSWGAVGTSRTRSSTDARRRLQPRATWSSEIGLLCRVTRSFAAISLSLSFRVSPSCINCKRHQEKWA